jgi:hypothetical protein
MNRDAILDHAKRLINGPRANEYGDAELNFTHIAQGWQIILGSHSHISAAQVALCLDWLKTCRLVNTPEHLDSYADKLGYTALAAEIATKGQNNDL